MSEASPDLHPQLVRPARVALPPRRSRISWRSAPAEETREPEDGYPLDPPLVDVRIPVRAPHATATAYSRNALMHRYPGAEVGDDLHTAASISMTVIRNLLLRKGPGSK